MNTQLNPARCPLQAYHLIRTNERIYFMKDKLVFGYNTNKQKKGYFYTLATNRKHIFKAII